MIERHSSRRRFIGVTAAAAGMALFALPFRGRAETNAALPQLTVWRGVALGADAVLQIHHPDASVAQRLIERSLAEVRRLERVFSLYETDSAISVLNRDGTLSDPPTDFVRLLAESEQYSRTTNGAFDATVQPLWRLYEHHFARRNADPSGPSASARRAARALVGHDRLEFDEHNVHFRHRGQALTFNGIAQGYITDRVAELLLNSGMEKALVDMGETRALGERPDGQAWRVGIEDPLNPQRIMDTLAIRNLAVATSGGYGTIFDAAGRFNHIFDPRTGLTSNRYLSISVVAPQATMADALSTAFSVMPLDRTQQIASRLGIEAHFVLADGSRLVQSA